MRTLTNFLVMASALSVASAIARAGDRLVKMAHDRILVRLKYDSTDNFLHQNVYAPFGLKDCYVHPEVHAKLASILPALKEKRLKLMFFDCYRPLSVQRKMWEIVPDPRYVADPAKGSNHNRGVAIDITLADEAGTPLAMPTEFDDFTEKAHRSFRCGPTPGEQQPCRNRALLETLLQSAGLRGLPTEWWHFELPAARTYPLIEDFHAEPQKSSSL